MANYIKQKPYYLNVPAGLPAGFLASIPQTNKSRSFMGIMDILGAGLGVVSSIGSMIGQNRAIRQQIKAQQEENQENREYNLMLARTQNQWNIEQWQRENDYNSPTAQMSRFRAAGLNPNLAYGQMSNGASSPTLTSGAASSPTDMSAIGNKRNFGQAMQEMLGLEMQKAQIEAVKAGTEKTKSETKGVDITNSTLGLMNEAQLRQYADQHKISEQEFKNLEKTNEILGKQSRDLDLAYNAAVKRYDNLDNEIFLDNAQRLWNLYQTRSSVLKNIFETIQIDKVTREKLPAEIAAIRAGSMDSNLSSVLLNIVAGMLGAKGETMPELARSLGAEIKKYLDDLAHPNSQLFGYDQRFEFTPNGWVFHGSYQEAHKVSKEGRAPSSFKVVD